MQHLFIVFSHHFWTAHSHPRASLTAVPANDAGRDAHRVRAMEILDLEK